MDPINIPSNCLSAIFQHLAEESLVHWVTVQLVSKAWKEVAVNTVIDLKLSYKSSKILSGSPSPPKCVSLRLHDGGESLLRSVAFRKASGSSLRKLIAVITCTDTLCHFQGIEYLELIASPPVISTLYPSVLSGLRNLRVLRLNKYLRFEMQRVVKCLSNLEELILYPQISSANDWREEVSLPTNTPRRLSVLHLGTHFSSLQTLSSAPTVSFLQPVALFEQTDSIIVEAGHVIFDAPEYSERSGTDVHSYIASI